MRQRSAFSAIATLVLAFTPLAARAVTVTQPYPIVPHTTASASQVQSDFGALYNTINGYLDASNLANGSGIYASQIVPTNSSQATFGGSVPYSFPGGLNVAGYVAGATVDSAASVNSGRYNFGSQNAASIDYNISSANAFNVSAPLNVNGYVAATNVDAAGSVNSGRYNFGSQNAASLDYNISSTSAFTLSAPLNVNGYIAGVNIDAAMSTTSGRYNFGSQNVASIDYNISNANTITLSSPTQVNGALSVNGAISRPISGSNYVVPYDANSVSGSGSTHLEHGTVTTQTYGGGQVGNVVCASSQSFIKAFAAQPTMTYSLIGDFNNGSYVKLYTQSISASAFQVCGESGGSPSGAMTIGWQALGE